MVKNKCPNVLDVNKVCMNSSLKMVTCRNRHQIVTKVSVCTRYEVQPTFQIF